jgi:hypothetical protein
MEEATTRPTPALAPSSGGATAVSTSEFYGYDQQLISGLRRENAQLREEREKSTRQYREALDQVQSTFDNERSLLANAMEERDERVRELEQLQATHGVTEQELRTAQTNIAVCEQATTVHDEKTRELADKLAHLQIEYERSTQSHRAELTQVQAQLQNAMAERERLHEGNLARLRNAYDSSTRSHRAELTQVQAQLQNAMTESDLLMAQHTTDEQHIRELRRDLDVCHKAEETHVRSLDELMSLPNVQRISRENLQTMAEVEAQWREAITTRDGLLARLRTDEEEIGILRDRLQNSRATEIRLNEELGRLRQANMPTRRLLSVSNDLLTEISAPPTSPAERGRDEAVRLNDKRLAQTPPGTPRNVVATQQSTPAARLAAERNTERLAATSAMSGAEDMTSRPGAILNPSASSTSATPYAGLQRLNREPGLQALLPSASSDRPAGIVQGLTPRRDNSPRTPGALSSVYNSPEARAASFRDGGAIPIAPFGSPEPTEGRQSPFVSPRRFGQRLTSTPAIKGSQLAIAGSPAVTARGREIDPNGPISINSPQALPDALLAGNMGNFLNSPMEGSLRRQPGALVSSETGTGSPPQQSPRGNQLAIAGNPDPTFDPDQTLDEEGIDENMTTTTDSTETGLPGLRDAHGSGVSGMLSFSPTRSLYRSPSSMWNPAAVDNTLSPEVSMNPRMIGYSNLPVNLNYQNNSTQTVRDDSESEVAGRGPDETDPRAVMIQQLQSEFQREGGIVNTTISYSPNEFIDELVKRVQEVPKGNNAPDFAGPVYDFIRRQIDESNALWTNSGFLVQRPETNDGRVMRSATAAFRRDLVAYLQGLKTPTTGTSARFVM